MAKFLMGVAAALFVTAGTTAKAEERSSTQNPSAQTPSSQSSTSQTPSSSSSATQSSSSKATASDKGTTASVSNELSGTLKKVDKDKKMVEISTSAGPAQKLKIADTATITKDGSQAGLDQLKEGDEVRASFDPSSQQATKLEVSSKQKMDQKQKSDSDSKSDSKTESKSKY